MTRRPRSYAAALYVRRCEVKVNAEKDAKDKAQVLELFFADKPKDQVVARTECRRCPMVVSCLREALGEDDGGGTYRWGIRGGLNAVQRNALLAAAVLGMRPDLVQARHLVRSEYRYRILDWMEGHRTPAQIAELIGVEWLPVNEVTARVAMWWLGDAAPLAPFKAYGDRRSIRDRLVDDYGPAVMRLREAKVPKAHVVAYLGGSQSTVESAVSILLERQRTALDATFVQAVAA